MAFYPVPEPVRLAVRGWHAAAGDRWLESVPATVDRLKTAWSLRETGPPYEGGSHSYVLPVERADGAPAVLKVIFRDDENLAEPTGVRAYGGDGAILLFDYDPASGAMLLERAEPGTPLLEHDFEGLDEFGAARRRAAIACDLYRRLWRTVPGDVDAYPALPKAADMLTRWRARYTDPSADLVERLGPERCRRALALCAELDAPMPLGIGNRDTHLGNIVAGEREPWLLLDPKPYLAERAFDGGYFVFKQVWHGPLGGAEAVRTTAARLGADSERVAAWAALRGLDLACDATGPEEVRGVVDAVEAILDHSHG